MLSLRKITASLLLLALCSCGFTPVYQQIATDIDTSDKLAAVEIVAPHDLLGQLFKSELSDAINPVSKNVVQKYRFDIKINKEKTSIVIQQDRSVTRYKITVRGEYKITEIDSGKLINKGYLMREGGYDRVISDYATYVYEDDTTKRIVKELAADAKTRLMATLLNM